MGTALTAMPFQTAAGASELDSNAAAMGEAISLADIWLEQTRQYAHIPALSVALVDGDRTIWSKGYGTVDTKGKRPATADTIYSVCSISKLFTAVAFMQQWEAGKVRLDEPVTTYLPWASLAPDDRESVPITMRTLLTHSAGLPRESAHPYWTGPNFPFPTSSQVRERISAQVPLYPASRTFQYSNLGLTLVGETVAAVTRRPYADYVTSEILAPLGMNNTRPALPAELLGKELAVGWGALLPDGTRPPVKLFDARGITPAAGFSSSVNDLARFAAWQLRLLRTGEAEVLRASTLREMQRVQYLSPDRRTSWGLGFANYVTEGREFVGHGGSCPGYRSQLLVDPANDFAIALAMNTMESARDLAQQLEGIFAARRAAQQFDPPQGEGVDLGQYTGYYDPQPWDRESAIVAWAGGLVIITASDPEPGKSLVRLKPLGNDRFRVVEARGEERDVVSFIRDRSGKIVALERFGQYTPYRRPL
ncbi:MAG: hypothetical protein A3J40_03020 [Erythrobacter sp. RIFCSPHIGHO2_12_FULL_63_10]|nr:MAG: hypothetical protein A3J40_03020 [Erythrobacter sp. RIFCSPHIGHO2_12_FULL_63_10]